MRIVLVSMLALATFVLTTPPAVAVSIDYTIELHATFLQSVSGGGPVGVPEPPYVWSGPVDIRIPIPLTIDSSQLNHITPISAVTFGFSTAPGLDGNLIPIEGFIFVTETGVGSDIRARITHNTFAFDQIGFTIFPTIFTPSAGSPYPDPGLPLEASGHFLRETVSVQSRSIYFGDYTITRQVPVPPTLLLLGAGIVGLACARWAWRG